MTNTRNNFTLFIYDCFTREVILHILVSLTVGDILTFVSSFFLIGVLLFVYLYNCMLVCDMLVWPNI